MIKLGRVLPSTDRDKAKQERAEAPSKHRRYTRGTNRHVRLFDDGANLIFMPQQHTIVGDQGMQPGQSQNGLCQWCLMMR